MKMKTVYSIVAAIACVVVSLGAPGPRAETGPSSGDSVTRNRDLIELWEAGWPAFGQFVMAMDEQDSAGPEQPPRYTVQTGLELAANPLLDYAFLSLEQHYDAASARAVASGLRSGRADSALPLLVRIPPISVDGEDAARARVQELLEMGADGVVIPHVMSLEEARVALSFFDGVNVWSPTNPLGDVVAMLIVEDPQVFAELEAIANLPGYSALVCGIGSLTSALNGDREAAEALSLQVLAQSQRVGMIDLMTVNPQSVAQRVSQGFLALLAYGPESNEAIRLGRIAAGR